MGQLNTGFCRTFILKSLAVYLCRTLKKFLTFNAANAFVLFVWSFLFVFFFPPQWNIPGSDPWPGFQHKQLKAQVSVYSTTMGWEAKNCFKLNWPQNTHNLKSQLMSLTEASISILKIDVCSSQEADLKKKIITKGKEESSQQKHCQCNPKVFSQSLTSFPWEGANKITPAEQNWHSRRWWVLYKLICKSWGYRTASTGCRWIQWNHRSHREDHEFHISHRSKTVPWLSAALQKPWYNNRKTMDCDLSV